jgi:hypothetical protein
VAFVRLGNTLIMRFMSLSSPSRIRWRRPERWPCALDYPARLG